MCFYRKTEISRNNLKINIQITPFETNIQIHHLLRLLRCSKRSAGHDTTLQSTVRVQSSRFLLAYGADVNDADELKQTPLHIAMEKENFEVISHLIDAGADIEARDVNDKKPIQYCRWSCYIKLLAKKGLSKSLFLL